MTHPWDERFISLHKFTTKINHLGKYISHMDGMGVVNKGLIIRLYFYMGVALGGGEVDKPQ